MNMAIGLLYLPTCTTSNLCDYLAPIALVKDLRALVAQVLSLT